MSLIKRVYFRSVYGALDYTSDLGGLFTALSSVITVILIIIQSYSSY